MEKKIPVKTLYLLLVISIGLIGLGVGSTYAVFTATAEIVNPIVFNSNLSYDSGVVETVEVTVGSRETKSTTLNISNSSGDNLNYSVWYVTSSNDIEIGTSSGTPTGTIASGGSTSLVVDIRNSGNDSATVILGISSGSDSVVIGSDMELVPSEELSIVTISLSLGEYVSYTPTVTSYTTDTSKTGYADVQTIYPSELNLWRVLNKNDDGTVDLISEYVSSTGVYFEGLTGFQNLVGYLNTLASQYETEGVTVRSRYFGYNGQTEYITDTSKFTYPAPWTCLTGESCNPVESQGGGDTLYIADYNQLNTVLGTGIAYKVGTSTATIYWMASRYYYYDTKVYYNWGGRFVDVSGLYDTVGLYYFNTSEFLDRCWNKFGLRPIVTLSTELSYTGSGTSDAPWQINTN